MKKSESKKKKRNKLLREIANCKEALPGNLTSAQGRSKPKGKAASASYGPVWRLTWKENKKTKTFYVRQGEVSKVEIGVEQMKKIKKNIRQIGEINLKLLIKERKES
ncbi:MAG: hypothetical protein A2Y62_18150 [Candidatus Fischerbacteria bacterium RBG_13_37_8]|uniref:DUF6788 domain-containing protein n=1 Tax=Candidatus Fischerbacteria bacterium RBG_13_37_8 TaxID=1817863 RepID=A0A1F5V839_9BACT|nr:MAG: hypothetical protein A2Y62_18150 [Candidatus Fischerbacteria bacterium RBG_13_37_8]